MVNTHKRAAITSMDETVWERATHRKTAGAPTGLAVAMESHHLHVKEGAHGSGGGEGAGVSQLSTPTSASSSSSQSAAAHASALNISVPVQSTSTTSSAMHSQQVSHRKKRQRPDTCSSTVRDDGLRTLLDGKGVTHSDWDENSHNSKRRWVRQSTSERGRGTVGAASTVPVQLHTRGNARERNYMCDHDGCGKAFFDKSTLKRHMSSVHLKLRYHA